MWRQWWWRLHTCECGVSVQSRRGKRFLWSCWPWSVRRELGCSEPGLCHLWKQEAFLTIEHSVSLFRLHFCLRMTIACYCQSFHFHCIFQISFDFYCLRISHLHTICLGQIRPLLSVLCNTNITSMLVLPVCEWIQKFYWSMVSFSGKLH